MDGSHSALLVETQVAWAAWLCQNHASAPGVWLQIAKKGSSVQTVSYAEALETALCYGWIDGQKQKGPDGTFLQRFTPRRSNSIWSQVNRAKALVLMETGRMLPAGLKAVEQAKANGRWDAAYPAASEAQIPDDLAAELRAKPKAQAFFERLSSQNRYAVLFRLQTCRKPETRARRLEKFVAMLLAQQTIYPQAIDSNPRRQT